MQSRLFLIGYRGTGKTTLGRLFAERLAWEFIDADVYLEAKYGASIKEIFATEGEADFRDKESAVLRELCGRERCVIATGGGIIMREENRKLLRESGFVVWLTAEAATIADRLRNDPTTSGRRPNLTVGGLAEIEELLRAREPFYHECAYLIIATDGRSPESLVETILTECRNSNSSKSSG